MRKAERTKSGTIFNIQKFSVNDGPGIRTTVFFKGCPLHCRWCANPESQLSKVQILWSRKSCINCHHCMEICPQKAVILKENHIQIDHTLCNGCKNCILECPEKALEPEGETRTVEEIIQVVLQDQVFYEESGGGLTISGGELLFQPDFACELLLAAKEEGLHTCCETTGFARTEIFDRVMEHVDYILFDMKHWNSEKHIVGTGVSNELPLLNMKRAIASGKNILPRIPVIPGFNDSLKDANAFAETLHRIGAEKCQLLPFHQFGENKYHLLGQNYTYENQPSLHKEDLEDYLDVFLANNILAFF
ncbi:MAG: glycyl-radical enzyme activating protein [Eubacteriales bacterium]|nr:glycyl-radical enzyme activating protein [Eubacteriales bacterium]